MTQYKLALISQVPELGFQELSRVAWGLQRQIYRHFGPTWGISAIIEAHRGVPAGYWPIRIQTDIGDPQALGYHTDDANQPYAVVEYTPDWTVTASHEMLEMLADPWGNALVPFVVDGKPVQVLKELCDPCEAFNYWLHGVQVSDFLTPQYYERAVFGSADHYSYQNKLSGPMAVATGGYLSYLDLETNHWFQEINDGTAIRVVDLGPNDKTARNGKSIREWISRHKKIDQAMVDYLRSR